MPLVVEVLARRLSRERKGVDIDAARARGTNDARPPGVEVARDALPSAIGGGSPAAAGRSEVVGVQVTVAHRRPDVPVVDLDPQSALWDSSNEPRAMSAVTVHDLRHHAGGSAAALHRTMSDAHPTLTESAS